MALVGEPGVRAGTRSGVSAKELESMIKTVLEVYPDTPRDHVILLLDNFHNSVADVLDSLADGSAKALLREWELDAERKQKQAKRKLEQRQQKRKQKQAEDTKQRANGKPANGTANQQQQQPQATANKPNKKDKRQRRRNQIKQLEPIHVVLDDYPASQPNSQPQPQATQPQQQQAPAPKTFVPPEDERMKRVDISELMTSTPAALQRTLMHHQRALQQQDEDDAQAATPAEAAAEKEANGTEGAAVRTARIVRPPQDVLDTELADHPAAENLRGIDTMLQEMEARMSSQWRAAREDVRLSFLRLTQSITMRETAVMRQIERELYREVQLLSKRKAMVEQLKQNVRKAYKEDGSVPADTLMKIEEFKTFSELDLPHWEHPRFYGEPEKIAQQLVSFGSLYNAATGAPPPEHVTADAAPAAAKAKAKPETIKLNMPKDLLRGPDPNAGKKQRKKNKNKSERKKQEKQEKDVQQENKEGGKRAKKNKQKKDAAETRKEGQGAKTTASDGAAVQANADKKKRQEGEQQNGSVADEDKKPKKKRRNRAKKNKASGNQAGAEQAQGQHAAADQTGMANASGKAETSGRASSPAPPAAGATSEGDGNVTAKPQRSRNRRRRRNKGAAADAAAAADSDGDARGDGTAASGDEVQGGSGVDGASDAGVEAKPQREQRQRRRRQRQREETEDDDATDGGHEDAQANKTGSAGKDGAASKEKVEDKEAEGRKGDNDADTSAGVAEEAHEKKDHAAEGIKENKEAGSDEGATNSGAAAPAAAGHDTAATTNEAIQGGEANKAPSGMTTTAKGEDGANASASFARDDGSADIVDEAGANAPRAHDSQTLNF